MEQPNPFALSVFRAYDQNQISLKTAKRAVLAVEHFHFAFTAITSSRSSGGISQMYARHASAIAALDDPQRIGSEIDELIEKLKAKRPSRDEFIAEFRRLKASEHFTREKHLVQYVLHRLSDHFLSRPYDRTRMTIEHLAPQSGKGHSLKSDVLASIGNLSWVGDSLQDDLGTKGLPEKIAIIQDAGFWLDEFLESNYVTWDEKTIRGRTNYFAERAYDEVWRIP